MVSLFIGLVLREVNLANASMLYLLAAGQRDRAREARQREREAVVLYDVVRLLSEGDGDQVLEAVAERLRRELQLKAVAVEMWQPSGATTLVSAGDPSALRGLREAHASARVLHSVPSQSSDHAHPGRWVRSWPPSTSSPPRPISCCWAPA